MYYRECVRPSAHFLQDKITLHVGEQGEQETNPHYQGTRISEQGASCAIYLNVNSGSKKRILDRRRDFRKLSE